jgi:hypothetical protein
MANGGRALCHLGVAPDPDTGISTTVAAFGDATVRTVAREVGLFGESLGSAIAANLSAFSYSPTEHQSLAWASCPALIAARELLDGLQVSTQSAAGTMGGALQVEGVPQEFIDPLNFVDFMVWPAQVAGAPDALQVMDYFSFEQHYSFKSRTSAVVCHPFDPSLPFRLDEVRPASGMIAKIRAWLTTAAGYAFLNDNADEVSITYRARRDQHERRPPGDGWDF